MSLKIRRESALNLTIEGSIGSFRVGTGREGQNSIEVTYFLTHVGLDFSSSANEALLSHLAPVREIFDINQLDFDEIMQRDIDDARVSSELIPYLLDEKSVDLVKLFPPIVVVVLPIQEGENRPAKLYPKVTTDEKPETEEAGQFILRSGSIGQEVFQFEQPISEGQKLKHDLVRFKLNTHKTRLVIVDGQHRAMALLALYRNLKDQWSDEKRAPFKEYYSEWTPKYIQKFNLKEINLPIILCTFPSLDEQYSGEFDLRKAARTVFLTLNREARKVSRTRNILLDDNDIIAYFLRSYLSTVKQKDQRSSSSLRISNIELDQSDKDKLKIESPIAITGVSHLYYIIEHLLLNNGGEVKGAKPRSGNFAKRKDLNLCMQKYRLNGANLLGSEMANSTKRDNFTISVAEKLREQFDDKYGNFILSVFEGFLLYENHNKAVLDLEQKIESYQDRQLKPILFEGQGISRVFDAHRENLKNKIQEGELSNIPEIQAITQRLDATAKRLNDAIEDFRYERANLCIKSISDKSAIRDSEGKISYGVIQWFNELYDNVLTTVAFQSGLICGFWGEIEKITIKLGEEYIDIKQCLGEYIQQLNNFFIPNSSSQLKKLVSIFKGEIIGNISDWKITQTNHTFRNVVYRGEMQPDQWTKYKYLILEIWHPTNEFLANTLNEEIEKCREQIFPALYNLYTTDYCKENSKLEGNLSENEKNIIFDKAFTEYNIFLKNVNGKSLDQQKMKIACSVIPASEIDESDME
ncbi:hypothetical protein CLI64_03925 [Nostoc sp. CENA543]|uniref:DNA sulfur modification protein DndB n=1 Tax=Nostoc sp. CENA543 TaxID=1869241 RepID=UPI000CA3360A|nr:DNA sulfur modification protein DndB [Nostoc sp. CENA543]AUS99603.1 hypothetical protein CLI64_03925 [Nostoc sp. CENA543]